MFNNGLMNTDVAIEIIAEMIADCATSLRNTDNQMERQELEKKKALYLKQRDEIYSGNKETINYVIEIYGDKLKKER